MGRLGHRVGENQKGSNGRRRAAFGAARVTLLAIFAVSRIAYYAAGLRFDDSPIRADWQIIDPVLMRTDLARSLWYLHMQPPGFNAWIGLCVKLFPYRYGTVLWAQQIVMGAIAALCLLELLRWFRVPSLWALALAALFVVSPACVLFEDKATYEYCNLFLVLTAAVALTRFCDTLQKRWSLAFFGSLLLLAMIRNSFHLVYLIAVGGVVWWLFPKGRKATLVGLVPLLAVTAGLYVKNLILFGQFTPSTWTGMQTGFVTSYQLTAQEADDLVREGLAHPVARISPFSDLREYDAYIRRPARTGIPVLDEDKASTGYANYNNLAYLQVHKLYLANAWKLWRRRPIVTVRALARAWFSYFLPAEDLPYGFRERRAILEPWVRGFDAIVFGQLRHVTDRGELYALLQSKGWAGVVLYTGAFLIVLIPVVTIWCAMQILVDRYRKRWTREQLAVLGFMLFTIVFLALLYNTLATSENNRTRFPVDPYFVVLLGVMVFGRRAKYSSATAPSGRGPEARETAARPCERVKK
jgi:hypothetical protein